MRFQDPTVLGWLALLLLPIALWLYRRKAPRRLFTAPWFYFQDAVASKKASHWQKWIQNLLFWIAFAMIALLVIILAKPQWASHGFSEKMNEMVLIVDTSVSMAATDAQDQVSSLERAKRLAEQLVRNSSPRTAISLLTLPSEPRLNIDTSSNRESMVHAIRNLAIEGVATDVVDQKKALEGFIANLRPQTAVRFITDRVPEPLNINLTDFQIHSVAAKQGANLGITKVEILRQPLRSKTSSIQFSVSGSSSDPTQTLKGKVRLYLDGRAVWIRSVDVNSNQEATFQATFDLSRAKHLKLVLSPDFTDALAQDDSVEVSLPPLRTLKLGWVSDTPERHLDLALRAIADTGVLQVIKYRTSTVQWNDPVDVWLVQDEGIVPELNRPTWYYGMTSSISADGLKTIDDFESLSKKLRVLALEGWGFESAKVTWAWRRVTPTLQSMYVAESLSGHRLFLSTMHPTSYPRWLEEVSYPLWVSSVLEWLLEPSMNPQLPTPITSGWNFQRASPESPAGWKFQPWVETGPVAVLSKEETVLAFDPTDASPHRSSIPSIGLASLLMGGAILLWLLETFWIAKHER